MCYTETQRLATRNNVRIKSENSHPDYGVERVFIEHGESAFLSVIPPRTFIQCEGRSEGSFCPEKVTVVAAGGFEPSTLRV